MNPPTLSDADKELLSRADLFDLEALDENKYNAIELIDDLASRLRAVLEGGREDRELLESFAECFGKGLYKPYKDHACIECDPTANGYPVTQGFRCCYHQLLARQSTLGEGKEG